ncbi:MAG: nuclear transport factor 2 family protein [Alphaproteobacteria bacterium]|nr:MAG: nuclear transport factor 2 family protein [Alphaproteobacteria bacterium]
MALARDRSAALQALADKQAIATVLAVHARGIDRADARLLASAYHDDGQVHYGFFDGPAAEFAHILANAQRSQPVTLHRPSNVWIALRGARRALAESYVIAYVDTAADNGDGRMQRLVFGRYLDCLEKRGQAWALTTRTYVLDSNINWPASAAPADPAQALAHFAPTGGHGAADAGRALLAIYAAGFDPSKTGGPPMNDANAQARLIDSVLAKQHLHELLMAYSRGVDRADDALLASVFHEDATVMTGAFNGAARDFVPFIMNLMRNQLKLAFHSVANEWFEVAGDQAVGESYAIALAVAPGNDGDRDVLTGGRYIDKFERRNGAWKISSRSFVTDWTIDHPSTAQWGEGMYETLTLTGKKSKDDPVYAHWGEGAGP